MIVNECNRDEDKMSKLNPNNLPECHIVDGTVEYWIDENNRFNRENGPAYLWKDGSYDYCKHGRLHRLDGPAVYRTKKNITEWWIDGKKIQCKSNEEFLRIVKKIELL
jgi:hypothetical protein